MACGIRGLSQWKKSPFRSSPACRVSCSNNVTVWPRWPSMSAVPSPLIPPPITATRATELPFASCCGINLLLSDSGREPGLFVAVGERRTSSH